MEENTSVAVQDEMRHIPLALIVPGKNPRRHFDPQKMGELVKSIRVKGVIQPVCLRPVGEKFEIVAGERRVRAALAVYGPEGEIPAIVKELSDNEAEEDSLIENTIRDDMSVTEEARAAGKVLARCKGDRDEAARILAWPMPKLSRRLALLELTEEVMDALDERKIQTGHAELLASVPKEKQNPTLEKIIELNLTVQFCRDNLLRKATKFEGAIFDTAGCAACRFNSETQTSLFSEHIDQGYCTHAECFDNKTGEMLEAIKAELSEAFPTVRIVQPGDTASFTPLEAEGNLGVGSEQYSACKSCGDFGATVSGLAANLGAVTKSVCFNQGCHQKKVAERIKSEKGVEGSTQVKPGEMKASGSTEKSAAEKITSKPSASEVSQRVKDYRRKVWNGVAKKEFAKQPDKARAFIFSLGASGDLHHADRSKFKELFQKIAETPYPDSLAEGLVTVCGLPSEKQQKLVSALAVATIESLTEKQVTTALEFLAADLAAHWRINAEYLGLLTKSEIESVAVEVGLDAAMGESYKKAMSGKKDESIKALLGAQFEWIGAIPKMLSW